VLSFVAVAISAADLSCALAGQAGAPASPPNALADIGKDCNPETLDADRMINLEGSVRDLDKAIAMDPSSQFAYLSRGQTWIKKGEFDKALADLDKALALDANDALAYYYRGVAHFKKGAIDRSIADLSKSAELSPETPIVYKQRGLVYEKKGEIELAFKDFDKALQLYSVYIEPLAHRGMIHESRGEKDRAIADYRAALAQSAQDDDERGVQREALERLAKLSGGN